MEIAVSKTASAGFEPDVRFIAVSSFLLTHAAFINSPDIAVTVEASSTAATSGAVVNAISIDNAALLGLVALAYGSPGAGPGQYLTCGSWGYSSNITITNSVFTNTGANAIALEAQNVQIVGNTFQHNHETAPYSAPGGQIYVELCADEVALINNLVIDGPLTVNGYYAEGLELHGSNLTVVNNTIANNAGNGIEMSGVQNVFVANWSSGTGVISNDAGAGYVGGISLYNAAPGDSNQRQVDSVTIDHAVSTDGQLAGVGVFLETGQTTPINHFALTNSCLAGNVKGATQLPGLGSDVLVANNLNSGCPQ